ncbi:MAG: biliverdin-producing heme oxygenase [Cytophagaceae bacterium]|nr:biliverdin-producing heme oxygenase [Cytophagaceae bacterium]
MLSTKIKEQTTASHRLLESHLLFRNLSGQFDKESYALLLHKLYVYYKILEERYVTFFTDIPELDIEKRTRAHLLLQDIFILTSLPATHATEQLDVPVIDTLFKAAGALYVIEGSTLGSKFIYQSLVASGINKEKGAAYFAGYGEETGLFWRNFISFLNAVASTEQEEQEVIEGAKTVFTTLYQWLNKVE